MKNLAALLLALALTGSLNLALAQDRPSPNDVLNLDASASSEIAPDLAVISMAVNREGSDTAAITQDVNLVLSKAITEAKATAGVQVASGGFSTSPRYDGKGQRNGWQVHAELIFKSKDFGTLGKLVGKLSTSMDIISNGFELSPELRASEEARMIDSAVSAFKTKANAAIKAFGYTSYSIREVSLGQAMQGGTPRPMAMRSDMAMSAKAAAPLPIESGRMTLQLSVNGSVQMRK
jgi:predicted secreted protein